MGRLGAGAPPATALIAAAGSGERLGEAQPKALVELAGRPMIEWSLRVLQRSPLVGDTVVAAPPMEIEAFERAAAGFELRVVAGGNTRSESVAEALGHADTELVAVHDAARPLLTVELVDDLIEKLAARPDAEGVVAAAPLTDTVKRAREPRPDRGEIVPGGPTVASTESRRHLWVAQTPQVFRSAALREAIEADPGRLAEATDDAWLVEQAGGKVLIHPAPADNLKVTTPFDLRLAELLLAERDGG